MDLNFCCSGERPPKGGERFAKSLNIPTRLDVCDIVFMLVSYSCTHTTIEQAPAHPPMKHEFKKEKHVYRREIRERFAEGWRKASVPESHLGPKWSSLSGNVATAKTLQSLFNLCFRCRAGQSVKQLRRMLPLPCF